MCVCVVVVVVVWGRVEEGGGGEVCGTYETVRCNSLTS